MEALASALQHCSLDRLDFTYCHGDVTPLALAIQRTPCSLTTLQWVGGVSIQELDALALAMQRNHFRLTTLVLDQGFELGFDESDENATDVAAALASALQHQHCSLTDLSLMDNEVSIRVVSVRLGEVATA